jgi:glycosyltransferase involved in cell wall biosynthesis
VGTKPRPKKALQSLLPKEKVDIIKKLAKDDKYMDPPHRQLPVVASEVTIICLSRGELSGTFFYNSVLVPLSLAEITNVIFFEPPWDSMLGILKNPSKFFTEFRNKRALKNQRKFPSRFKSIQLFCIFPWGWQNRFFKRINDAFLLLQIKLGIQFCPISNRILLMYWRDAEKLATKIPVARRIYHCTDEIGGFPWPSEVAKRHAIMEEAKVAKIVDIVLVTSSTLMKKMSRYNSNVKTLANDAVDFDLFNKALSSEFPAELDKLQRPLVGYVGDLVQFKVDFDLVKQIAAALPDWSFVFVGPLKKDVEVPLNANLSYLGPRIREEIPKYIAAFDVCIIPHKVNLYMKHSFPMKLYEYFALGKPVVATQIPALKPYDKYVYLANNLDQFTDSLKTALEENSAERQKERIHLASLHSWRNRSSKILKLLLG